MPSPTPRLRHRDLDKPEDEVHAGDGGEDEEPEPEEDVDLLVDDVHAENAEGVVVLDRAGASVPVEGALGHLGEDPRHGIDPLLGCFVREAENLKVKGHKLCPTG